MITICSKHATDTKMLAKQLLSVIPEDVRVIVLEGTLGSGKTTFTKGLAEALEIKRPVNSPTYTILKTYQGTKKLHHLDLYRLNDAGFDFDLEEYIYDKEAITVIEWAEKVPQFIPNKYIKVVFDYIDEETRNITILSEGISDAWEVLLSKHYF